MQEAVLHEEGLSGLVKMADENCQIHPLLYLAVMQKYDKKHDYVQIEEVGERALEKVDSGLTIRSKVALRAAYASSCLTHTEKNDEFLLGSISVGSNNQEFSSFVWRERNGRVIWYEGKRSS